MNPFHIQSNLKIISSDVMITDNSTLKSKPTKIRSYFFKFQFFIDSLFGKKYARISILDRDVDGIYVCPFQELPIHEMVSSKLKNTLNALLQPVSCEINNLLLLLFDDDVVDVDVLAVGVCELELELNVKNKNNDNN